MFAPLRESLLKGSSSTARRPSRIASSSRPNPASFGSCLRFSDVCRYIFWRSYFPFPVAIAIDSDFWEDLLVFIEEGKVIPVIGEGVVTFGPDNQNLYGWLAKSLAKKLQVPPDSLPATPTLNDVVCRHLLRGGARNVIYTRLQRLLRDECPEPGTALRELASISAFNFFLTTTFDPLLENALNAERYGGQRLTQTLSFFPEAALKDLPVRKSALSRATV